MPFLSTPSYGFLGNARAGLQMSIRLGIASSLSFTLGTLLNSYLAEQNTFVGGLWSLISTIVVIQNYVGGTLKASWQRFLGTFVGAIAAGLFVKLFGATSIALGICVFCVTLFCFLTNLLDSFRLASLTAALVIVLWAIDPETNPWRFGLLRFLDSVVGISVGLLVSCFFWATQAKHKMKDNFLMILDKIYKVIQAPPPHVANHLEAFEEIDKEIRETMPIIEEAKLEVIGSRANIQAWEDIFNHLIQMIEALKVILCTSRQLESEPAIHNSLSSDFQGIFDAFKSFELRITHPDIVVESTSINLCIQELRETLQKLYPEISANKYSVDKTALLFVYYYNIKLLSDELEEVLKINVNKI